MDKFQVRISLRYKLLFLLTSLPVVSLALYLLIATDLFRRDKVAYVFDSSATVSRSLATQMRLEMQAAYASLRTVVEHFDFQQHQFLPLAQELFEKNPKIQAILLFRREADGQFAKQGQLLKQNAPAQSFSTDEKIQASLRERALSSAAAIAESKLGPGLVRMSFRLGEPTDPGVMILMALYQAEDTLNAFDSSGIYNSMVMTRSGIESINAADLGSADLQTLQGVLKSKAGEGTAEVRMHDGLTYLVSYASVGLGDLAVVSKVDKSKALKAVEVLIYKSLLFFVALIAFTLLISVVASGKLTSALSELFEATQQIAKGDFSVRVEPRSRDEVGGLAESFNWMAGEVSRLMTETAEKARLQSELDTVRTVQETLFPPAQSQFGPLKIRGHYEPASECGGDWWNYSVVDGKIYLWIGDATGHGAPAALITSAARSAAAIIESLPNMTPGLALSIMNRAILETSKGKLMMTFFVACIDLNQSVMTYASASHDPPYLMRKTGEKLSRKDLKPLNDVNGPRLGDRKDFKYEELTIPFGPGDMIFLYTDGALDIENSEGKKWGERAFLKTLLESANDGNDVASKIGHLCDVVAQFRSGANLIDDVTLVMCEYEIAKAVAA